MERRVRWKSHARCGAGEKSEIISNTYLSLLYPDDLDLIFDENGDLKDEEELDGGLCDGDERDVLTFIFPEHLLSAASNPKAS